MVLLLLLLFIALCYKNALLSFSRAPLNDAELRLLFLFSVYFLCAIDLIRFDLFFGFFSFTHTHTDVVFAYSRSFHFIHVFHLLRKITNSNLNWHFDNDHFRCCFCFVKLHLISMSNRIRIEIHAIRGKLWLISSWNGNRKFQLIAYDLMQIALSNDLFHRPHTSVHISSLQFCFCVVAFFLFTFIIGLSDLNTRCFHFGSSLIPFLEKSETQRNLDLHSNDRSFSFLSFRSIAHT